MSYKALYRKYRPKTFDQVLGQEHIITTLKNIIKSKKISHAYLFAGPRGTGKTSVAHVFAAEINKSASGNHELNPLDVIEIDAASNNGVAEVRSLIDASKYAPHQEKYKIYIIDEVHMLTKGAFNALLKTLEEPPAHVIFIFATTEQEKLPITILSRLQTFNFKQISRQTIEKQLHQILQNEKVTYDEESIKLIATIAQGGMRDALSIADQAIAFGNNKLSFEIISEVFGITSLAQQIDLINFAYQGKAENMLTLISKIVNQGLDLERLTSSLINLLKDVLIYKKTETADLLSYLTLSEVQNIIWSEKFIYDAVDVLMELIIKLKTSVMLAQAFEIAMLKLLSFAKTKVEIKNPEKEITKANIEISSHENTLSELEINKAEDVSLKTDNLSSLVDDEELENTLEMALEDAEQDSDNIAISNDILDTQEISLNNDLNDDKPEDDQSIDLASMFEGDNDNIKVIKADVSPSNDELINLLIQADKAAALVAKQQLKTIPVMASNERYRSYISLFDSLKLIAKGKNFILLTSDNAQVVKQVRADRERQSMIDFANETFKLPTWVYTITLKEFEEAKKHYSKLKQEIKLPAPIIIEPPKISEAKKTKEEEYGSNIFGNLFD